jgi:signal transduction histidine kinase
MASKAGNVNGMREVTGVAVWDRSKRSCASLLPWQPWRHLLGGCTLLNPSRLSSAAWRLDSSRQWPTFNSHPRLSSTCLFPPLVFLSAYRTPWRDFKLQTHMLSNPTKPAPAPLSRDEVLATLAHELRDPLNSILLALELQSGYGDPAARRALAMAAHQTWRATANDSTS